MDLKKESSFVDTLLQPISKSQKSYLKDTTDFINFIEIRGVWKWKKWNAKDCKQQWFSMEKYQLYPLKNRSKMEKQPIKSPTQTLLLSLTSKGSVACLICTIHPRVVPYSEGVSSFNPRTGLSTFKLPTITSKRVFWGVFGRFYILRGVLKKIHTLHGVFLPAKKFWKCCLTHIPAGLLIFEKPCRMFPGQHSTQVSPMLTLSLSHVKEQERRHVHSGILPNPHENHTLSSDRHQSTCWDPLSLLRVTAMSGFVFVVAFWGRGKGTACFHFMLNFSVCWLIFTFLFSPLNPDRSCMDAMNNSLVATLRHSTTKHKRPTINTVPVRQDWRHAGRGRQPGTLCHHQAGSICGPCQQQQHLSSPWCGLARSICSPTTRLASSSTIKWPPIPTSWNWPARIGRNL